MQLFFAWTLHLFSLWWKGSETDRWHRCEVCSRQRFTCVTLNSRLHIKKLKRRKSSLIICSPAHIVQTCQNVLSHHRFTAQAALMASKPSRISALSSSGCGASHPDRPPPLPRGAAAGQCHTGVSGQRGLPLPVEAELEGGGQQQHHTGLTQPGGPGERRPLQLEQHPEPPCRPVEEGGLGDLWGQSEWTELCHSNPGPSQLLSLEVQQHFLSGNHAASVLNILMELHIFSAHRFLHERDSAFIGTFL